MSKKMIKPGPDLLTQVSRGDKSLDDLDLNPLLITVDGSEKIVYDRTKPRNAVPDTLDAEIIRDASRFFSDGEKMQLSYAVRNTLRTIGTRTSSKNSSEVSAASCPILSSLRPTE